MLQIENKKTMITAMRAAGKLLLDQYGRAPKIKVKESDGSIVTETDIQSERIILDILDKHPEQFNIISEECGIIQSGSEYTWIIDPIDGTSNFAAGLPWFGVIMALMKDKTPVQGGMYLPLEEQLYYAEKDGGAWKNDKPIRVSRATRLNDTLLAYSFDHSNDPGKTAAEMKLLGRIAANVRNIRTTNSLVDFCYVADGRLGAVINQTTKIWDIAGPSLIISEAGGSVCDIRKNDLDFEVSPDSISHNYSIVASGQSVHKELLNLIEIE
jgi:myo-inositol-1(or 4)-monophosphatase